jgi:hypothetical protein
MNLLRFACFLALLAVNPLLHGQQSEPPMQVPKVVPVPPLRRAPAPKEPVDPPARDVPDAADRLSFHLPAGWNLSAKDGEISSFHLDARTAPRSSRLRAVASLGFNPYPQSTFAGALFYVSAAPHSTASACTSQTSTRPFTALPPFFVDDVKFARGKDEHGQICTDQRDVAYTALRNGTCLRIDLAINSFCGGEVSGAQDLTEAQLQSIYDRLQGILMSVRFQR